MQLLEQREDGLPGGLVEVAGGLVGQDDGRLPDQGAGDRHPLPLPDRDLGRARLQPVAEPDRGQRLGRAFPPLPDRHAGVEQPVGDVVQQGGVLGEEELLEHEPHPARP